MTNHLNLWSPQDTSLMVPRLLARFAVLKDPIGLRTDDLENIFYETRHFFNERQINTK